MKQTLEQIADHNVDMVLLYTSSENIQSLLQEVSIQSFLQEVSKRFFERISDKRSFFHKRDHAFCECSLRARISVLFTKYAINGMVGVGFAINVGNERFTVL